MLERVVPTEAFADAALQVRVHALTIPAGASLTMIASATSPSPDDPGLDFVDPNAVGQVTIDSTVTAPSMRQALLGAGFGRAVRLLLRATKGSTGGTFTATLSACLVLKEHPSEPAQIRFLTTHAYDDGSAALRYPIGFATVSAFARTASGALVDLVSGGGDQGTPICLEPGIESIQFPDAVVDSGAGLRLEWDESNAEFLRLVGSLPLVADIPSVAICLDLALVVNAQRNLVYESQANAFVDWTVGVALATKSGVIVWRTASLPNCEGYPCALSRSNRSSDERVTAFATLTMPLVDLLQSTPLDDIVSVHVRLGEAGRSMGAAHVGRICLWWRS